MGQSEQIYVVALGANLPFQGGSPASTLRKALEKIDKCGMKVEKVSNFFLTPAYPAGNGPDYVNAAATIVATLPPMQFLLMLHKIEDYFARHRAQRWGARTLDLDFIAAADAIIPDLATYQRWQKLPLKEQIRQTPDELILPHPRLAERVFVLRPMLEVSPKWRHPITGLSVEEMFAKLPAEEKRAIEQL